MEPKYSVREPGKEERVFTTSRDAIEHLVSHPGYAQLYANEELVMTKGISPTEREHREAAA